MKESLPLLALHEKPCSKCCVVKLLSEFPRNRNKKGGYERRCKQCANANTAVWQRENPERVAEGKKQHYQDNKEACLTRSREWNVRNKDRRFEIDLERKYHLTLEEYLFILAGQNGRCAVCAKTPEENGRRLAVDHDHACCPGNNSCGKCVRSLLCSQHNMLLGQVGDDVDSLKELIGYLESWNKQRTNSVGGSL